MTPGDLKPTMTFRWLTKPISKCTRGHLSGIAIPGQHGPTHVQILQQLWTSVCCDEQDEWRDIPIAQADMAP